MPAPPRDPAEGAADTGNHFPPRYSHEHDTRNVQPVSIAREAMLKRAHRMFMLQIPVLNIAQDLNVTLTEVGALRREIDTRLRNEAANADLMTFAGHTLAFYNMVRADALRMAADPQRTVAARNDSYRTALKAEADKQDFLKLAGFFDGVKYTPRSDATSEAEQGALDMNEFAKLILDPNADWETYAARVASRSERVESEEVFGRNPEGISVMG